MATNWTDNQKLAIGARGKSIVVSAAAGSGKTSVLTERLVQLLAEEGGIDASRLVVVTFTKAAAKSLSEKLFSALSEKAAAEPENRYLSRQLLRLSRAQISTIHSFCFTLIRKNKKALGLTGKISIGDEARTEFLRQRAVKEAVEQFLREKTEENKETREKICRIFGDSRSLDKLYGTLISFQKKISSIPDAMGAFRTVLADAQKEAAALPAGERSFFETELGAIVAGEARAEFERGKAVLDFLAQALSVYSYVGELYAPFFEERSRALSECLSLMEGGRYWDAARFFEQSFEKSMPSVSKKLMPPEEEGIKKAFSDAHNNLKKELMAFCKEYFYKTEKEIASDWEEAIQISKEFLVLAETAEELYTAKKREKKLLDYADLETMALSLVAEKKNGIWQKSALGKEITEEFDAVYVDEYQDTNGIQDLIFRSITREDNLFIVGDPKQSIYRFRGAEPSIFSEYKNKLPLYPSPEGAMQKIFLSNNFRCSEPIIDLVNRIFSVMMDSSAPDSLYKKEDELVFSKEKKEFPDTELILIEKEEKAEEEPATEEENLIRDENREAGYIAERIGNMILGKEGKPRLPSEIAVICRTNRQIAKVRDALSARGIPCGGASDAVFAEKGEYLFVSSLLAALDNPSSDIPLLGALISPVFRFSPDALYRIRNHARKMPFYSAMRRYAENGKEAEVREKCREVIGILSELRKKSKTQSLSAFLFSLYRTLSIAELYGEGEEVREFFLNCASAVESYGETALSDLCSFAALSAEKKEPAEEGDGVKLYSIHKSKGLEFPVVFVSFLAQPFKLADEQAPLLIDERFGLQPPLLRLDGRAKIHSVPRKCVRILLHERSIEEEKRVLYVALTRASEKLILTAKPLSFAKLSSHLLYASAAPMPFSLLRLSVRRASSPLMLLLYSLRNSPALRSILEEGGAKKEGTFLAQRTSPEGFFEMEKAEDEAKEAVPFSAQEVISRLGFAYEEKETETLPKKLSVSQILRQNREEEEPEFYPRRLFDFEDGKLKSSAAMIGTATHKVMQFADFAALCTDPEAEFLRLVERGFLSEEEMALCEKEKVIGFIRSPLYAKLASSPRVCREKRFNVFLPAKAVLQKEGEVLVQGVIDAWFENPGGTITLLDFKTDRVKEAGGEEILLSRHGEQMRLYKMAVEAITKKKVSEMLLYSFSLGREIEVPQE